jgi:hypothetical protein
VISFALPGLQELSIILLALKDSMLKSVYKFHFSEGRDVCFAHKEGRRKGSESQRKAKGQR